MKKIKNIQSSNHKCLCQLPRHISGSYAYYIKVHCSTAANFQKQQRRNRIKPTCRGTEIVKSLLCKRLNFFQPNHRILIEKPLASKAGGKGNLNLAQKMDLLKPQSNHGQTLAYRTSLGLSFQLQKWLHANHALTARCSNTT